MKESTFERKIVSEISSWAPDIYVQKNDPQIIQGFPDRVVFYKGRVAFLEFKRSKDASARPNQAWYIDKLREDFGFAEFIYPGNADSVIERMHDFLCN